MNDLSAEEKEHLHGMLPSMMLFSVVWSLGASCDKAGRLQFDQFFREQVNTSNINLQPGAMIPSDLVRHSPLVPARIERA